MPDLTPHQHWLRHIAQLDAKADTAPAPSSAPRPSSPGLDLPEGFDIGDAIEPRLQASRRPDGWTAARQRAFCEAVAAGASIESAARAQGLSASSAYSFRHSAKGAAFGIGWLAAQLLQRQRLADTVSARAFDGQTVTVTRPDGTIHERHFHDNRLAMSVLTRLDRIAAGQIAAGTPDISGEGQAARLAAAEFDRYLDILGTSEGGGAARAGLFLAARVGDAAPAASELAPLRTLARADLYARTGAGVAAELDTADLDPAARAGWTADQWARAEAAGLLVLAPAPVAEADTDTDGATQHSQDWEEEVWEEDEEEEAAVEPNPVWWDDEAEEYRTDLPCPDGELPEYETGDYGDDDYERTLTAEELALVEASEAAGGAADDDRAASLARRDRWLARLRAMSTPDGADEAERTGQQPASSSSEEEPRPVAPAPQAEERTPLHSLPRESRGPSTTNHAGKGFRGPGDPPSHQTATPPFLLTTSPAEQRRTPPVHPHILSPSEVLS